MVAHSLVLPKHIDLGVNLPSFSPGFVCEGIIIDNDTGNWLLINSTYMIPPWTYGWSQPLPGTQSVSIIIQPGPAIVPSVNLGSGINVIFSQDTVPQSNGFTAVTSVATVQTSINVGSIIGPVTIGGTVDVSGSNVNAAITNVVNAVVTGTVAVGGSVDVSGSTVTATISNVVTISGTVDIGTITGGTVNIGTVAGNVEIIPGVFTLGGNGVTKVAATGTAVALHGSLAVKVVMVKARSGNNGTIYVGTASVTNNETAGTGGLQLDPGDMIAFTDTDIGNIYLNGTIGDGVSYMYWV